MVIVIGFLDFRVIGEGNYNEGTTVPLMTPHGVDYNAVYEYGVALRKGLQNYLDIPNIYTPFVTVALLPLTLLTAVSAYRLFTIIILTSLFASLFFSLREKWSASARLQVALLAFTGVCILFQTYPINFSLERGNSDIIAAAFMAGSLFYVTRNRLLLSVVFLTVATQFKVYPVILFLFLFTRFGWKSVLHFTIANLLCLLIIGPSGAGKFIASLYQFASAPYLWVGNHSWHSFLHFLRLDGLIELETEEIARSVGYSLFLLSFGFLALRYFIQNYRCSKFLTSGVQCFSGSEVGLIGICFCLMSLLPSVGHDYKLAIHVVPLALLMTRNWEELLNSQNQTKILVTLLSGTIAFLMLPRIASFPFRFIGLVGNSAQMKTPWLLLAFVAYSYLAFVGSAKRTSPIQQMKPHS